MSEVKRYRFISSNGYAAIPVVDSVKAERYVEEQEFDRVTAERDAALLAMDRLGGTIDKLSRIAGALQARLTATVRIPERLVMTDGLHTYEYVTGHNAAIDKMLGKSEKEQDHGKP